MPWEKCERSVILSNESEDVPGEEGIRRGLSVYRVLIKYSIKFLRAFARAAFVFSSSNIPEQFFIESNSPVKPAVKIFANGTFGYVGHGGAQFRH